MKKTVILGLLVVGVGCKVYAQTPRVDTIVLSVYNTSQRFMLYPMPFGGALQNGFTRQMQPSYDTVHVLRACVDSTGVLTPV